MIPSLGGSGASRPPSIQQVLGAEPGKDVLHDILGRRAVAHYLLHARS